MQFVRKTVFFALLMGLLFPVSAFAQAPGISSNISVSLNPQHPGVNERVAVQIESFSADLRNSTIWWYVNGQLKRRGVGATQFTFETGRLGSRTAIDIIATTREGERIERTLVVRPAEVDILWSANTYTPPLYTGKALATSKSTVKLTAMPRILSAGGDMFSPETLTYTWQVGRMVAGGQSGRGKQSIVVETPRPPQKLRVSVVVSDASQTYTAVKNITIPVREPRVRLYERHPTEGIRYEQALNATTLFGDEIVVRAEPFFFSREEFARGDVEFVWRINNTPAELPRTQQELTLRRAGEESGTSNITVEVFNLRRILQEAFASLTVHFGLSGRQAEGVFFEAR